MQADTNDTQFYRDILEIYYCSLKLAHHSIKTFFIFLMLVYDYTKIPTRDIVQETQMLQLGNFPYLARSKSSKPHLHFRFVAHFSLLMRFTSREIKTEIWIIFFFFSFMKIGNVWSQQKCSVMALLCGC